MDIYGKQVNGEIYATDTVELSGIIDKIETITEEYNDNIVHEAYKAKTLYNMNNLSVGQDWALLGETKVDAILNHKNTYYASFSEWRSTFQLKTYNSTHSYFAFLNETYITPSTSKTDFRTDELIYKFDPTLGANTELRDYQPKSKPPSATIGYSTSISGEITDSGDAKIGTSISNSYSTLEESPKLHDQGNMRLNYAEIRFDYLRPFDNKGIYYDYNVGQSYQSSVFVIKAKKQSQDIIIQNDRDVTIVRDGFWSNSIITFELKSKSQFLDKNTYLSSLKI